MVLMVCGEVARAQGEAPAQRAAAEPKLAATDWTVALDLRAWYAGPGGDVRLRGAGSQEVSLTTLNVDSPRLSPAMELTLRAPRGDARGLWGGEFMATASLAHHSSERSATLGGALTLGTLALNAGDAVRTEFVSTQADLALGQSWLLGGIGGADGRVQLRGAVLVGARIAHLGLTATTPGGGRAQDDVSYAHPLLRAKIDAQLGPEFAIETSGSYGLLGDYAGGDAQVALTWSPNLGWREASLGVQVGYRIVILDIEKGEGADALTASATVAGLFAGVTLRF